MNTECPICYEINNNQIKLICGHTICCRCLILSMFVHINDNCALCREYMQIRTYTKKETILLLCEWKRNQKNITRIMNSYLLFIRANEFKIMPEWAIDWVIDNPPFTAELDRYRGVFICIYTDLIDSKVIAIDQIPKQVSQIIN